MRRKDREMNRDFGLMVIDKARFATLAMVTEAGKPYAIPVSPARVGDAVYIHSAQSGLHRVQVLRIDILDVTAKRKKFDSAGEEMKWGRME